MDIRHAAMKVSLRAAHSIGMFTKKIQLRLILTPAWWKATSADAGTPALTNIHTIADQYDTVADQ